MKSVTGRWAPEVLATGKFSFPSDVFDAGRVIIQILTEEPLHQDPVLSIPTRIASSGETVIDLMLGPRPF
ncbi:hypothetical protein Pelo_18369 [Pelomyxa schiedti]|nr:hypothetical protein Pelo_18369 [Pelomyxa schiedti]